MLKVEGVSTAKIVLFHQGSTELRRCENCVTRRLLGPHDTLPCVLIDGYYGYVDGILRSAIYSIMVA